MVKPLFVQTDRSPAKKIPFSGSVGGQAYSSSTAQQTVLHTVPEGYRDEIHLWCNNASAATAGRFLWRFGAGSGNDMVIATVADTNVKTIDGVPIEGVAGGLDIEVLSITQAIQITGYVIRTPIG